MDYRTANKYFRYNSETGIIYWEKKPCRRVNLGAEAGGITVLGYRKIHFSGKFYLSHRIAWLLTYGYYPDHIDHKNHDGLDNRIINLRDVERSGNMRNLKVRKTSKSGITGIRLTIRGDKWIGNIRIKGQQLYLGTFNNIFDAACARKSAENKHGYFSHP